MNSILYTPVFLACSKSEAKCSAYIHMYTMYACMYTDKIENKIFLLYKEIQMGSVAKSYIRKGFLIYEEMRKYFTIYKEAVSNI